MTGVTLDTSRFGDVQSSRGEDPFTNLSGKRLAPVRRNPRLGAKSRAAVVTTLAPHAHDALSKHRRPQSS